MGARRRHRPMTQEQMIPLINAPRYRVSSDHYGALNNVLDSFNYGSGFLSGFYRNFLGGENVQKFEQEFAHYIGTKYAISTTSGTAALHTAIEASMGGRRPGRIPWTVLTTPYTFVASASAIFMSGNKPVFGDIDPQTLNLDPSACRENIAYEQPKIIIAVHLLGQPMDLQGLRNKFPRAIIIEDCAQALGATIYGKKVGSIGDMGCFSFQETKTMTTLGEGGMITTNNEKLAELCRNIRNHGEKYGHTPYLGYNYRMTEAAAAFGRCELKEIDERLEQQIKCAKIVRKELPEFLQPINSSRATRPVFFIVGTLVAPWAIKGFDRKQWTGRVQKYLFGEAPPGPGRTVG